MESERAETLKTLHAAAAEIGGCETIEAACERTIVAAEEVLAFEMCSILLHEDGWLDPAAISSGAPEDGARRMRADQGLAGKTFQTSEAYVVDSIRPDDETDPAKEFYQSAISVPIGDVGVFQAVSRESAAFDDGDVEFVELLVAHTASAIERIRFERELQDRKEALRRQNERLEEFASVVSHDLRNPLSMAEGRLELAREECDSEHLDLADDALARIERIIEDVLWLAREGQDIGGTEPVDLAECVEAAWTIVADDHEGTTLVVEDLVSGGVDDGGGRIEADGDRLQQLLENLFRNAIEHGATANRTASDDAVAHGGEEVTVTVGWVADGFYVEDDGPGIPEEDRRAAFEAGYSTSDGGTGFGLDIVREIAEAHGWEISITDAIGGGARFEITGVESAE